jgi:myo-inositol-1-phosphate synthase
MEGTTFGNVPLKCEVKLEVWDSPNSAGVVIDAIRCARLALDRGIAGALVEPSSYFMKTPPAQFTDYQAMKNVEDFIASCSAPESGAISRNGNGHSHSHKRNGGIPGNGLPLRENEMDSPLEPLQAHK